MTAPIFGIQNTYSDEEILSVSGADFSKILLIETSEDADPHIFPIGEPVRFVSNDKSKLAALGTGPLMDAVRGINAQLEVLQSAADITIIRVAEGTAQDAQKKLEQTSINIVTAIREAKDIPSIIRATPRLVWAGRTAWRPDLNSANPVAAALPELLNAFLAIAICDAPDSSFEQAVAWRETISSERILAIGVGGRVIENTPQGLKIVNRSMGPRILGLGVRADQSHGGKPFNPWANEAIYGITSTTRPIPYSLVDGACEGQLMLASHIGIVVAGDTGIDLSIADGGFIYIGTRSCSKTPLWSQYHQLRGRDYITVRALRITRQFLGKKASIPLVEAWILSLKEMIKEHVVAKEILGGRVDFPIANPQALQNIVTNLSEQTTDGNSVEKFRNGDLIGCLRIEPTPVIERVTHEFRTYRQSAEISLQSILASMNVQN